MRPPYPKKPTKPKPPTSDDLWLHDLRRGCTKALVQHLKRALNTSRPIKTLTIDELDNMVEAVTAQWIVLVSAKLKEPEKTEAMVDAITLLI